MGQAMNCQEHNTAHDWQGSYSQGIYNSVRKQEEKKKRNKRENSYILWIKILQIIYRSLSQRSSKICLGCVLPLLKGYPLVNNIVTVQDSYHQRKGEISQNFSHNYWCNSKVSAFGVVARTLLTFTHSIQANYLWISQLSTFQIGLSISCIIILMF